MELCRAAGPARHREVPAGHGAPLLLHRASMGHRMAPPPRPAGSIAPAGRLLGLLVHLPPLLGAQEVGGGGVVVARAREELPPPLHPASGGPRQRRAVTAAVAACCRKPGQRRSRAQPRRGLGQAPGLEGGEGASVLRPKLALGPLVKRRVHRRHVDRVAVAAVDAQRFLLRGL